MIPSVESKEAVCRGVQVGFGQALPILGATATATATGIRIGTATATGIMGSLVVLLLLLFLLVLVVFAPGEEIRGNNPSDAAMRLRDQGVVTTGFRHGQGLSSERQGLAAAVSVSVTVSRTMEVGQEDGGANGFAVRLAERRIRCDCGCG